jgi:hypothetical protein
VAHHCKLFAGSCVIDKNYLLHAESSAKIILCLLSHWQNCSACALSLFHSRLANFQKISQGLVISKNAKIISRGEVFSLKTSQKSRFFS